MKYTIICMAIALIAVPAAAQRDRGEYGVPAQTPENLARFALRGSSGCALRTAPGTAVKVLTSPIASAAEAKQAKSLRVVARSCYQPQWPDFVSTDVRNAIAEAQYRERYRIMPKVLADTAVSPPASFGVAPAGVTGTPQQDSAWFLAALANCVVFAAGADVHNLIIGPVGVPEEDRRFGVLKPALSRCQPAGSPVLTSALFRGYLADALWMRVQSGTGK